MVSQSSVSRALVPSFLPPPVLSLVTLVSSCWRRSCPLVGDDPCSIHPASGPRMSSSMNSRDDGGGGGGCWSTASVSGPFTPPTGSSAYGAWLGSERAARHLPGHRHFDGLRILQQARGRPVRADLTFVNDNDGVRGFDVRCRAGGHWLGDGSTPPHAVVAAAAASFFHSDGFAGRLAGWRAARVGCRARRPLAEEEGCCERMGRSRRDSFRTTHATCRILVARDGVVAVVLIGGGERGCLPDLVPIEVFWDVGDLVPLICRCFVL